jgi:CRISPR-associated protein Csx17
MDDVQEIVLSGCNPEPLGSYLKALGILRVVAEQADGGARGCWRDDQFVLCTRLDREGLLCFFRERWAPTPVIAPWNGGSGFWPKDNTTAADAIVGSDDPRHSSFADVIRCARRHIADHGWQQRPEGDEKLAMLQWMRANLPDAALPWIDAAVVVANDRMLFPPLLGTGGNDGRLDFSNNFQQRVVEVTSGKWDDLLVSAIFGDAATSKYQGSTGQFQPASGPKTNPWDFVFLIEGSMLFVAAASRRLEQGSSRMAFPFHARAAGGSPTVADGDEDSSRDEIWLPLWRSPAEIRELERLFAEGRATVGHGDDARAASTSLDFARAATSLGTDRGIDEFSRTGFHVRNGLSVFATPLGRVRTQDVRASRLLDDVDGWFRTFRSKTSAKNVPASIALVRRRLELAMFEAVDSGALGPVLLALGEAEKALGRSLAFATKAFLGPLPTLQPAWGSDVEDGSVEQRIAAALATRPDVRTRILPLDLVRANRAFDRLENQRCVFLDRPFVDNLHGWLRREEIEWARGDEAPLVFVDRARCSLADISDFIEHRCDDELIERWLRAFSLLEETPVLAQPAQGRLPGATYALLSLVHGRRLGADPLPRTPVALASAIAGSSRGATEAAVRRLEASGLPLPFRMLHEPPSRLRRIAAALAIPLSPTQRVALERLLRKPESPAASERKPLEPA